MANLTELERTLVESVLHRRTVARDINVVFEKQLTFGDRVADRVAAFGGSWKFIGLFAAGMAVWMVWQRWLGHAFDPYPYILLNLVLSCMAAMQAPVIMMSQNRQVAKDRLDARHDYEVNTKAELEIAALHVKLDDLREHQWGRLVEMQERQIALLERIVQDASRSDRR